MNLSELASKLNRYEVVHVDLLNIDVQVCRLSLVELQEVERLADSCSTGSGKNRQVTNLAKLVYTLVKKFFKDAEGNPLASEDKEEDAKEWPAALVIELMKAFQKVNGWEVQPDPN